MNCEIIELMKNQLKKVIRYDKKSTKIFCYNLWKICVCTYHV